jgi:RNA polymerase sigma-70 factor, ECF subfamily
VCHPERAGAGSAGSRNPYEWWRAGENRGGTIDGKPDAGGGEITRLVERWSDGDGAAFDRLIELVYEDLRQIAHRQLRLDRSDHTINTTALVHEAYVRLAQHKDGTWQSRAQFFAFASKAMRHILIDAARRRLAAKRGGTRIQVSLSDDVASVEAEAADLLALNEALDLLAEHNDRMAKVVECRFFGGLSVAETAEALASSERTVEREWTRARVYLQHVLDVGSATG